ncbi:hypothetical protein [Streptomyces sp. XY511]|uniref:hypothetical protein n=1 Tax=Streptomyces sp. XY511 TaxID=1519480 RepID=UPI00131BCFF2|nr:hypothetical protein [Streptomyces sp. XY511]
MSSSPNPGTAPDEHSFIATAETLLATRLDVVRPLAGIMAERAHLQAQLDDVERRYGAAYANAEAGGWTAGELAQMGATEPTRRPPGRPKRRAANKAAQSIAPASPPNPRSPETAQTPAPSA